MTDETGGTLFTITVVIELGLLVVALAILKAIRKYDEVRVKLPAIYGWFSFVFITLMMITDLRILSTLTGNSIEHFINRTMIIMGYLYFLRDQIFSRFLVQALVTVYFLLLYIVLYIGFA
jgi:hypothetical protein